MLYITSLVLIYPIPGSLYLWPPSSNSIPSPAYPPPPQGSKMFWSGQEMGIIRLLGESNGGEHMLVPDAQWVGVNTCLCTETTLSFHCFLLFPGISICASGSSECMLQSALKFFLKKSLGTWYSSWSFLWAQRIAESEIKDYLLLFLFLWGF